jgi:YafQ family addiction module toxin component
MTYNLEVSEQLDRKLEKLSKKSKIQLKAINKKVNEILENPQRFKPLRGDRKGAHRVHIEKSFVLVYEIDEKRKTIKLLDYDHHNKIYK